MANEITLNNSLVLQNGNVNSAFATSMQLAQTSARFDAGVQNIGTTHELIALKSDIATPGMSAFQNNGPTNYVEIGIVVSSTFYPVVKLKVGESAQFRISSNPLYAKANTAAVDLAFLVCAD